MDDDNESQRGELAGPKCQVLNLITCGLGRLVKVLTIAHVFWLLAVPSLGLMVTEHWQRFLGSGVSFGGCISDFPAGQEVGVPEPMSLGPNGLRKEEKSGGRLGGSSVLHISYLGEEGAS